MKIYDVCFWAQGLPVLELTENNAMRIYDTSGLEPMMRLYIEPADAGLVASAVAAFNAVIAKGREVEPVEKEPAEKEPFRYAATAFAPCP